MGQEAVISLLATVSSLPRAAVHTAVLHTSCDICPKSPVSAAGTHPQNPPQAPVSAPTHPPQSPRPCKLLLCGEEDAGQGLVAGALLKVVQGVQVHTISLPVLVLGGSGDTSAGLVQLLEEALRR